MEIPWSCDVKPHPPRTALGGLKSKDFLYICMEISSEPTLELYSSSQALPERSQDCSGASRSTQIRSQDVSGELKEHPNEPPEPLWRVRSFQEHSNPLSGPLGSSQRHPKALKSNPRQSQTMNIGTNWFENENLGLKLRVNESPGCCESNGHPPDPLKPSIMLQNSQFRENRENPKIRLSGELGGRGGGL